MVKSNARNSMSKQSPAKADDVAPGTETDVRTVVRDAASLIIVKRAAPNSDRRTNASAAFETSEPRILLGQRRPGQIFLPNKFVFPGGRVDAHDAHMTYASDLTPRDLGLLAKNNALPPTPPELCRALALAAVRETFEEVGLAIGTRSPVGSASGTRSGSDAQEQSSAPGDNPGWAAFAATGVMPDLAKLTFFARAVTPPGRTRRYDTRFFSVDARHVAATSPPLDDELRNVGWFTLSELEELDVASITKTIIGDLKTFLASQRDGTAAPPVPHYTERDGTYVRDVIDQASDVS